MRASSRRCLRRRLGASFESYKLGDKRSGSKLRKLLSHYVAARLVRQALALLLILIPALLLAPMRRAKRGQQRNRSVPITMGFSLHLAKQRDRGN
jgi:hypothetical protein